MPTLAAPRSLAGFFSLLFGFILPMATVVIELHTSMCADSFFDPLPSPFHILLVAGVPVTNLLVWHACWKGESARRPLLLWMNAVAIGVSAVYSILFFPILPLAVIGILAMGLGLLPMAPLFSLITACMLRYRLRDVRDTRPLPVPPSSFSFWCGGTLGVMALVALEIPRAITNSYLHQAANSPNLAERASAVRTLRAYGSREILLNACYDEQRTELFRTSSTVNSAAAREVYYRVTGTPFNAVPRPPQNLLPARRRVRSRDDWSFDPDVGGETVSGRISGLKLASSSMDGFIEPDAAVAYAEWTMVFTNSSAVNREARMQVALPPGGVVSRLTLWVNGEEREAAFAGRGKVRDAYRSVVVVERRDPVLVTTSGRDRDLVQCFPVPAGGQMKIRFGITAPLAVDVPKEAMLQLPSIIERNFTIDPQARHEVSLRSASDMLLPGTGWEKSVIDSGVRAKGTLSDLQLSGPTSVIRAMRRNDVNVTWSPDSRDPSAQAVKQTWSAIPASTPGKIVFVIDGSMPMRAAAESIATVLANAPASHHVVVAGDDVSEFGSFGPGTADGAAALLRCGFEGGSDNYPALLAAWKLAAGGGAIVWIHGPQPMLLSSGVPPGAWKTNGAPPALYDLQVLPGLNKVTAQLEIDGIKSVHSVPHVGTAAESLQRLFQTWKGERLRFVRERVALEDVQDLPKASDHLSRLWAADEVERLAAVPATEAQAVKLGSHYQLVTAVTGAVVLETKEQYERAGLEPVDGSTVPTVPEPEEWALIAVAAAALTWGMIRRRRACKAA